MTPNLAEICGLLCAEGSHIQWIASHGKINICKKSIIQAITKHSPLGNLRWRVPIKVMNGSNRLKVAFIRGYFDGDGTVSNRVRMFSTNKVGLHQVSELLNQLGVKHTIQKPVIKQNRKPIYTLQISQLHKERFLKIIQPVSKRPGYARVVR